MNYFDPAAHRTQNNNTEANDEQKTENELIRFGMRLAISTVLHPFEYSKVLIQLGYEPIPPRLGTCLLGRKVMMLPNIFQYIGHIRSVDGFFGCYRALTPKLIGNIMGVYCSARIADYAGFVEIEEKDKNAANDEDLYINFKLSLKREVVMTISTVVVTHPFYVITVRSMAQFIGRETIYNTILSSIKEIFQTEGIKGFFSGIIPKMLGDVAIVVLSSSTVYMLNKYLIKEKTERMYNAAFTQFLFSSLLYPLQVVATCMTVTGSRLMAGQPTMMPLYGNWVDCWNDLQQRAQLKRGSSLIWRQMYPSGKIPKIRYSMPETTPLAKYIN